MKVPWPVRFLPAVALRVWFTPPPLGDKTAGKDTEATAGLATLQIPLPDGTEMHGFSAGDGPLVLALHGWGGRAAQMAPIARRLATEGWTVVALDLPGRAGGEPTDVVEVAAGVAAAVEHLGRPEVVVAHSFSSVVMRLVFTDQVPPAIVMLAPLMRVSDALDVFAGRADLRSWTRRGLERRLRRWNPTLWQVLDDTDPGQFPGAEILILHDPSDLDTPFPPAAELAARRPGTTLAPVADVGHAGILTAPDVLEQVVDFISLPRESTSSALLPAPGGVDPGR